MKMAILMYCWLFVFSLVPTLGAQEATDGVVNIYDFEETEAETAISDDDIMAMLEGNEKEFAREFIAKAITKRSKYLDVSYISPDSDDQKSGWNVRYNLQYRRGSDGGFSIDSGAAKLRKIELQADISGSYSFGNADNVENFSSAKIAFAYILGNFGKLRVIDKATSEAFQRCLAETLDSPTENEKPATEDNCWLTNGVKERVSDPSQSYVFNISAVVGLEGDQDYDNYQLTYGVDSVFSHGVFPSVRLGYERIDAGNDKERMALTDDNTFERLSGEVGYRYPIFEYNDYNAWLYISYRYFKEIAAPSSIRNADLDEFDFFSASIRFPAKLLDIAGTSGVNIYLRYTDGQLPFSRRPDQSVQLGFSSNISVLSKLFAEGES